MYNSARKNSKTAMSGRPLSGDVLPSFRARSWARSSFSLAAAALVITISATAPDAAKAAGILTCLKLKQNCDAYAAHIAKALARTRTDQVGERSSNQMSVAQCQEQYASAEQTGIWPAHGATPDLPCTKN
jgi:hypothetical protein